MSRAERWFSRFEGDDIAGFVQLIEWKTSKIDKVQNLDDVGRIASLHGSHAGPRHG